MMESLIGKLMRVLAAAVSLAAIMLPFDPAFAITAGRTCVGADPRCFNFLEGSETGNNTLDSPQLVVGNGIVNGFSGIEGGVGGTDTADVFEFHFAGGPFAVQVLCLDATVCTGSASSERIVAKLYNAAQQIQGVKAWNDSNLLSGGGDLTFSNLAAGIYLLEVYATTSADPPYLVAFENNDTFLFVVDAIPTPEPAMLALFGLGLLGLGISRRKKA